MSLSAAGRECKIRNSRDSKMIFRWMIQFLNILFILSLGMITLWLFCKSLASDRVRRSSPKPRAELLLEVLRDGSSFLKIPLNKSHYLIGRGPECDIPLMKMGIPLRIGEISEQGEGHLFKNFKGDSVTVNNKPIGRERIMIYPGDEIRAYNYCIRIRQKET